MANATPEKAASNNHIPLTPTVKITQMIMRFLLLSKSTLLLIIVFKPEAAIKPYNIMAQPPKTQLGIDCTNA